jgi:hypothetical protein
MITIQTYRHMSQAILQLAGSGQPSLLRVLLYSTAYCTSTVLVVYSTQKFVDRGVSRSLGRIVGALCTAALMIVERSTDWTGCSLVGSVVPGGIPPLKVHGEAQLTEAIYYTVPVLPCLAKSVTPFGPIRLFQSLPNGHNHLALLYIVVLCSCSLCELTPSTCSHLLGVMLLSGGKVKTHPNSSSGTVREPQQADVSSGFAIEQAEAGAGWSVDSNNTHTMYLPGPAENDVRKNGKTHKRAISSAMAATIKETIDGKKGGPCRRVLFPW